MYHYAIEITDYRLANVALITLALHNTYSIRFPNDQIYPFIGDSGCSLDSISLPVEDCSYKFLKLDRMHLS